MKKEFKKSDLRSGMRVETRQVDGESFYDTAIVFCIGGDIYAQIKGNSYHNISADYTECLLHDGDFRNLDIVRVYDAPTLGLLCDHEEKGKLLWERKEDVAITLDGVEYSESTLRSLIKKATQCEKNS